LIGFKGENRLSVVGGLMTTLGKWWIMRRVLSFGKNMLLEGGPLF
jgi:hypothetical protein